MGRLNLCLLWEYNTRYENCSGILKMNKHGKNIEHQLKKELKKVHFPISQKKFKCKYSGASMTINI